MTTSSPSPTQQAPRGVQDRSPRRRWFKRVLALGMGLTVSLVFAEVALRIAEIGYPQLYAPDQYCGARLRPSTTGVFVQEGHGRVSINSLGFRGPEISIEKPPNVRRVAVLGDSFVEALQVNDDETLCRLLEKKLNSDLAPEDRMYEVLNCGVSGYGTAQQLLLLHHYVLPLKPDVVLLAIYPENDVCNNRRSLEGDPARPYVTLDPAGDLHPDNSFRHSVPYLTACSAYERRKAKLVNRSFFLQLLKQAKQNALHATPSAPPPDNIEDELSASAEAARYAYVEPAENEQRQAWKVTERLIQELAKTCQSEQIRLVVFTVSTPIQVYPDTSVRDRALSRCHIDDPFYSERRIHDLCARLNVAFIPLASILQREADGLGTFFHGFSNTRLGTGHWNQAGHAAAARVLADRLLAASE